MRGNDQIADSWPGSNLPVVGLCAATHDIELIIGAQLFERVVQIRFEFSVISIEIEKRSRSGRNRSRGDIVAPQDARDVHDL